MSYLVSGSALGRAMACPSSVLRPRVYVVSSKEAADGTRGHLFLDRCFTQSREAALELALVEDRPFFSSIQHPLFDSGLSVDSEVAVVYRGATGKVDWLGRGVGREYDCGPDDIPATLDVYARLDARTGLVGDHKFGHGSYKAKDMPQLWFGAMCMAKLRAHREMLLEVYPVRDTGRVFPDRHRVDEFDLGAFEARLQEFLRQLKTHDPANVNEGDHCKWCPAWTGCPAKTRTLAVMATGTPDIDVKWLLDNVGFARAYEAWRKAEEAMKSIRAAMHGYAEEHGPQEVRPGVFYGSRPSSRRVLDAKLAMPILEQVLGSREAAFKCVVPDITLTSIAEAMGTKGAPYKAVVEALEAAGALTAKASTEVKEWRSG